MLSNAAPSPGRRHFLRSSAALIALPFLESYGFQRFARALPPAPAKRMLFLGFGWGVTENYWLPDPRQTGSDWMLTPGLEPLRRHKAKFTLIQGLSNKYSHEAHWGSTVWLTGANRYAVSGQSFSNSVSVDQVAARQLGVDTRFASIQVNGSSVLESGHGPGLSLAWDLSGKPVGGVANPVELFHKLFSPDTLPPEQRREMLLQERSVLDTVLSDAQSLSRRVNQADRDKLEEYLEGIREIELRLAKEEQWLHVPRPAAPFPAPKPGLLGREEIKLVYELLVAAFKTDSTRVASFRQPVNTLVQSLDLKVDSHDMSHHQGAREGEKVEASRTRDRVQSELLAGLLDRLLSVREPDGSSLFDHSTVVFGSNIQTGHIIDNCPTLIAGGGSRIKLGEHLVAPKGTPLCNAWLTLLRGNGIPAKSHGDSSGILEGLPA